jgi:hypothetical protein
MHFSNELVPSLMFWKPSFGDTHTRTHTHTNTYANKNTHLAVNLHTTFWLLVLSSFVSNFSNSSSDSNGFTIEGPLLLRVQQVGVGASFSSPFTTCGKCNRSNRNFGNSPICANLVATHLNAKMKMGTTAV